MFYYITPYRVSIDSYPFHSMSICPPIPGIQLNENLRSRSWVRSKLKVTTRVQHSADSHHFRSMSIGHPIPELWLFQNLTLKIKGQGHSSKSKCRCYILWTHIPFVPCQSALPFQTYSIFKISPWKSRVTWVKVKWPWCCTTTLY